MDDNSNKASLQLFAVSAINVLITWSIAEQMHKDQSLTVPL